MRSRANTIVLGIGIVLTACGGTTDLTPSAAPVTTLEAATPPPDCVNPPPDVATLIEQENRPACYGDADLTIEAHATRLQGAIDCPGELEPSWLGCGGLMIELYPLDATAVVRPDIVLAARSPQRGTPLAAVIHPAYDIDLTRGLDQPVTASGHFDDPEARTCRYTNWPDALPPPADDVVQQCRSTFVITHLEPLVVDEPKPSEEPASGFEPDTVAQVVDTDLVIRTAPGVGPDSVILPGLLNPPTLLYVIDGPVPADGFDWYEVMPSGIDYLPTGYPVSGWVAAGSREGAPWIGPAQLDCPNPRDLLAVVSLSDAATVACYGPEPLTLEGTFDGCHAAVPGTPGAPAWLWSQGCVIVPSGLARDAIPNPGALEVRFEQQLGLGDAQIGQVVRVTGHFDDPAAGGCTYVADAPLPAAHAVLRCRAQFVATSVENAPGT